MKIVIDTNDFISAMIGKKHREKLSEVLKREDIEIFADDNLTAELEDVAYREKFKKYKSFNYNRLRNSFLRRTGRRICLYEENDRTK